MCIRHSENKLNLIILSIFSRFSGRIFLLLRNTMRIVTAVAFWKSWFLLLVPNLKSDNFMSCENRRFYIMWKQFGQYDVIFEAYEFLKKQILFFYFNFNFIITKIIK